MSAPRRWLEGTDELSQLERELLSVGASMRPPTGAKHAVRAAIAGITGATAAIGATSAKAALGVGGATQASSAGSATTLVFLKGLGLGLVLGTAVAGGVTSFFPPRDRAAPAVTPSGQASARPRSAVSVGRDGTRAPTLAPSAEPAPESAPAASRDAPHSALPEPAPSETAKQPALDTSSPAGSVAFPDLEPAPASFTTPPTPAPTSNATALAESHAVAEARSLLRSGNPRAALERLQALEREFPAGILAQERDALAIEALLAIGDSATARERAKAFLARYPKSPDAAAARRALSK